MPKKFSTENTKAVAARDRKNAAKSAESERKEKEKEDEYWKDNDKHINRKLQRKEEQERKKTEQSQKKAELRNLVEQEEAASIKGSASKQAPSKVTRAMILEETEKRSAAAAAGLTTKKREPTTHIEKPLEENINRIQDDSIEARSITEAIAVLSTKELDEDKHPERRLKAAYAAFEEAQMPRIKSQNPTLRLSQLKQILKKEWMKSSDNPLNQKFLNK